MKSDLKEFLMKEDLLLEENEESAEPKRWKTILIKLSRENLYNFEISNYCGT